MRKTLCITALVAALAAPAAHAGDAPDAPAPGGDRIARAVYDRMLLALREAETLYYEGEYVTAYGDYTRRSSYRIWLKKPNCVRIEAPAEGDLKGVLVGDGLFFWIYWPGGLPESFWRYAGGEPEAYESHRMTSYMKKRAPPGGHSISHQAGDLAAGLGMFITNPSAFHGATDSMQGYLNEVRSLGEEKIGGEECFVIEADYMKGQRQRRLWVSKEDFLPRLQREFIYVSRTITQEERWLNIRVDGEIADDKFRWRPPEGWRELRFPEAEAGLLDVGSEAPDFDVAAIGGGRITLRDLRGKIVWLNVWRAG